MKFKFTFLFGCLYAVALSTANAAVSVKKAAPVATQSASVTDSSASLVGSVLGLVSTVQQLNAKQKALTEECIPSSSEINFVDKIVKEWAMTGSASAKDVESSLRRKPCDNASGGYAWNAKIADQGELTDVCFDTFKGSGNDGMVWAGFPKVGIAKFCPNGDDTCKTQKTVSDIYDIFNLVDFETKDYTAQDLTMAAKLMDKIENCSSAKLSAKKRALWGEFLTTTLGNVGQKTNTANILQQVSSINSSGGGLGSLGSLGTMATQYLDR
ncbi:MAG: hypothetical protein NC311_05490 [Muribaculaceae bacterium]|nr:hypothetical protein [Muribaculaceae bacterium]